MANGFALSPHSHAEKSPKSDGYKSEHSKPGDSLPAATTIRFDVKIDGHDFASFTGISGLNANYEVLEYAEGGQNAYAHQLPGRLKYTTVVLTRPIDKDSGKLAKWFSEQEPWKEPRTTAKITAYDANESLKTKIAEWALRGVWPVRYTGPTFSATAKPAMAYESLELAHRGFTLKTDF